jgi:hypothetical protein
MLMNEDWLMIMIFGGDTTLHIFAEATNVVGSDSFEQC